MTANAIRSILRDAGLRQRENRIAEMFALLIDGLSRYPHSADLHFALGSLHAGRQEPDRAIVHFERTIALEPGFAQAHHNLGVMLKRRGQAAKASVAFSHAVQVAPGLVSSQTALGELRLALGDRAGARGPLTRAIMLQPADVRSQLALAIVSKGQDDLGRAITGFARAAALDPTDITARLGLCMARLPILYDQTEDIEAARARYRQDLETLASIPLDHPAAIDAAAAAVGSFQPYYLAYQEHCDRDLQELYGRFVCGAMAARYPGWAKRLPMPPIPPGAPLRIGIASGFFRWHTIWKLMIRGWMDGLDPARVQLFGYHTAAVRDEQTAGAARRFHRFAAGLSFEAMAQAIRADNLHVLIYPEIGMDAMASKLATLRLAPVQCVSWGHPDTTGMPTIDYFLSSDLMEPEGADAHYSERLIRLPGLGIGYAPLDVQEEPTDFAAFGVRPTATVYLCCQYVSKYLPQYDDVFAHIAAAVPDSQFLFINPRSDSLMIRLRRRLDMAFGRYGLDAEKHVVTLPYLTPGQYAALNRRADVYLDSIGWSGGNTTLEAVAAGLPVVTLPGALMRGRHSSAILTQIGVTETVASDLNHYIEIAVRLASDTDWRRSVSARVAAGCQVIYADARSLRALEAFLDRCAAGLG